MTVLDRIEQLGGYAHDRRIHMAAAVAFVLVNGVGYAFGGVGFVQGWGGGLAAVIATAYLVWKSQGYWAWMMVNAALWCALFFDSGLPLLGWLQVALLVFSAYGMTQWALVRFRIGWEPNVTTDLVGGVLGLAVLAYAVYAYRGLDGYTGTLWWGLEAASVLLAIAAMWLDAFRYRANWYAWSLSNIFFWPVAFHGTLWGPFFTAFVYQAINIAGWLQWTRDERRLHEQASENVQRARPVLEGGRG
jgi:nicotinamide mononucleotide transporter